MAQAAARCITEEVAPVSVFLAVHDELLRAQLERSLGRRGGLRVVGAAHDGGQAYEAIVAGAPDVAVVETGLPTLDGLALCERVARARPEIGTRILLLDGVPPTARDLAVAAGAAGCLPATAKTAQLCDAVASIANGGTMFHI
jgi:DNA-binding NarL/FixJ family response regulator